MYIGIYISDSFISTATVNQDDEVVMIKDESAISTKKLAIPLKIYLEDNFAYLGDQVDYLIANDYSLKYTHNFLDDLEEQERLSVTYTTETPWNAASIIAIFLKKILSDIVIYSDQPVKGAVVTISRNISSKLSTALKWAFDIVHIPLLGVIDFGKSALLGYDVQSNPAKNKNLFVYNLDQFSLSISLLELDKEGYCTTHHSVVDKNLGEQLLHDNLSEYIVKRYEEVTKKTVKKTKKNDLLLKELANELLHKYISENKLYINLLCTFENPIIELITTRAQIDTIVATYISKTFDFIKTSCAACSISLENIDEVLVAGLSDNFQSIQRYLGRLFSNPELKIYMHDMDTIITQGVAVHANDRIQREISSSLLVKTDEETDATAAKTSEKPLKDSINREKLISILKTIQINEGCDV